MKKIFKRVVITIFALHLNHSYCQEKIIIQDSTLELREGEGRIYSEEVSFHSGKLQINANPAEVNFYKKEGLVQLDYPGLQISYDFGSEGLVSGIEGLESQGLSLTYLEKNRIDIKSSEFFIKQTSGQQFIPAFHLKCSSQQNKSVPGDTLNMCLSLGSLDVPIVEFDKVSGKAVARALEIDSPLLQSENNTININIKKVEDLKLFIINNDIHLSFKARYLFKWTIKIKGHIDISQEQNVVNLRVDSAKAGIFSLKKNLLKRLKKANLSSVEVQGDMITIKL